MPYDLMYRNLVHIFLRLKVYTLNFAHYIGFLSYHLFTSYHNYESPLFPYVP
jgi:hypothetical protein